MKSFEDVLAFSQLEQYLTERDMLSVVATYKKGLTMQIHLGWIFILRFR